MNKLLIYSFTWPVFVFVHVVGFLVWYVLSDGRWKQRQGQPNPANYWQDQALAATRELRELEITSRRQLEETESKFRKELKRKEREIGISQRS